MLASKLALWESTETPQAVGSTFARYVLVWGSLGPLIHDTGSRFPLPRAEPVGPMSMSYGRQYTERGWDSLARREPGSEAPAHLPI